MAANDFLSGFRTGADAYNQARALKDRRDATKQQGEFDKLRLKLEEERNALTKQGLDDTAAFREKSLAEQVASREDASARDNRRIENDTRRVENDSERLRMQGEELAARMREADIRAQLANEQVTALRYGNESTRRSLEAYDDVTAAIAKRNMDLDALGNEEAAISKLLNDSLMENPDVASTPNFKALSNRLLEVKSIQQAVNDSDQLKRDIMGSLFSSEKTAPYGLQLLREMGQQAKGLSMSYTESTDPYFGTKVPSTRVTGDPKAVQAYIDSRPKSGDNPFPEMTDPNSLGGSLNPQTKPKTTPGQESAFSVLNIK